MRTARPKAYHRLVTDVHAEKQEVKLRWRSIVVRICGRSFIIQEMLGIRGRLDCLKRQWSLVEVEAIRLAMLLRDSHTIRDVILFPLPRPEKASNVEDKKEWGPARNYYSLCRAEYMESWLNFRITVFMVYLSTLCHECAPLSRENALLHHRSSSVCGSFAFGITNTI
jgi:hypothetical protein